MSNLGAIFDTTGSFRVVFYFNAVTYALTSALYGVIIAINRFKPVCLFPPSLHADAVSHINYGAADVTPATDADYVTATSEDADHALYRKLADGARTD